MATGRCRSALAAFISLLTFPRVCALSLYLYFLCRDTDFSFVLGAAFVVGRSQALSTAETWSGKKPMFILGFGLFRRRPLRGRRCRCCRHCVGLVIWVGADKPGVHCARTLHSEQGRANLKSRRGGGAGDDQKAREKTKDGNSKFVTHVFISSESAGTLFLTSSLGNNAIYRRPSYTIQT